MERVQRNTHGLRDAMFDVLDALRNKNISLSQAKTQMEAAKAICMTVSCEREELDLLQRHLEIERKFQALENKTRVIDHDSE